jgi:hypothetical protein
MKISTSFGTYKIIQTLRNQDELLILSKWDSLTRLFDREKIFLVNPKESIFGTYMGKQECAIALLELIKHIDYRDWDHLDLEKENFFGKIMA